MLVFVNNRRVEVFGGATLLDVVRAYSLTSSKRLLSGYLAVYDLSVTTPNPMDRLWRGVIIFCG